MRILVPSLILCLAALAGCDVRDSLVSVLELRPAFTGDARTPPAAPEPLVRIVYSAQEEAVVRESLGIQTPFLGVDYRGETVALVARQVQSAEGHVEIDRVELRGQHQIVVRSRVVGRGGASAQRTGVAAVAIDRFGDGFTDVRGDFQ